MFDKAIQFLKDHKEIALATSEGNLPKLRIFQIMKQEGHVLYFATSSKKAVYRELRQNPNVEILAYADNISVRCSGMVNFNVEDDVKRWIYDHNPVLSRLYTSYDQMEYFCLPIAEMDYYDLTAGIPTFRSHFRRGWTRFRRRKIQEIAMLAEVDTLPCAEIQLLLKLMAKIAILR